MEDFNPADVTQPDRLQRGNGIVRNIAGVTAGREGLARPLNAQTPANTLSSRATKRGSRRLCAPMNLRVSTGFDLVPDLVMTIFWPNF